MKYVCDVCGWVYDEEETGVKWEDVAEDFECPLCSVGKDQFSEEKFIKLLGEYCHPVLPFF